MGSPFVWVIEQRGKFRKPKFAMTARTGKAGITRIRKMAHSSLPQTSIARASKLTCSRSRIARKIAARFSMLGFPVGDNLRCRLLLGLAVSVASC